MDASRTLHIFTFRYAPYRIAFRAGIEQYLCVSVDLPLHSLKHFSSIIRSPFFIFNSVLFVFVLFLLVCSRKYRANSRIRNKSKAKHRKKEAKKIERKETRKEKKRNKKRAEKGEIGTHTERERERA